MYGKYLLFANLGSYVACLDKVFKFLWRVVLGGFSVDDEQRPKLVSAHPQIPLRYEKCVMMWNSTFCKTVFPFFIVIFQTMLSTRFGISPYHAEKLFGFFFLQKSAIPHHHAFHFFHKSGSETLTLACALICFITPTFFIHQNDRTDLTYMWVQFKLKHLLFYC